MLSKQYIAGFIDGEGCFNIALNPRGNRVPFPRLLIVNTDLNILLQIQDQYGGDITSRKNGKLNWKIFRQWRGSGKTFKKIVPEILPYLIIKKRQAEICMRMIDEKDLNERLKMKEEIMLLNKKGI